MLFLAVEMKKRMACEKNKMMVLGPRQENIGLAVGDLSFFHLHGEGAPHFWGEGVLILTKAVKGAARSA